MPVLGELAEVPAAPAGLLECLAKVTDPRKRRGVRHSITAVVALALAATLAGAQFLVAIGEWVADAGDADLAALGIGHVLPGAMQVLQLTRKTRRHRGTGCTPKWSTPSPRSHPATRHVAERRR